MGVLICAPKWMPAPYWISKALWLLVWVFSCRS